MPNNEAQSSEAPLGVHAAEKHMGAQGFVAYLAERHQAIEDALRRTQPNAGKAGEPGDGIRLDLSRYLYDPLSRFTSSGGKRTRPALCMLGAEAVGADPARALSFACAVENFQSAALIHDDIADKGELRRGEPCVHVTEGVGVAINIGDLALVNASRVVLDDATLGAETKLRLLRELTALEERTIEGQALDLGWVRDGRWNITPDDYLYMAAHKTAYYSAAVPLAAGAICGGASERQVGALREFGMSCGLAFQLQDDLLNLVGDAAAQGKDFRSDITEGKRTLAAVWALAQLDEDERAELQALLDSGTTDEGDLARTVELMRQSGAIEHVRDEARRLVDDAKGRLASADFLPKSYATLISMADFFVERLG